MTTPPRVAIYLRVSTEEQAEGHSLDAQRKLCTQLAETRGWQIVATYEDPGYSAKTEKRPAFQRLLADARAGNVDIILTHKLDRFSRSIFDIFRLLREFHEHGISYVSAAEQFDFTTPMGKVQLALWAAFAEWYIDNLSAETSKGKKERAMKGLWNGDVAFGYKRVPAGERVTGRVIYALEADEHDADGVRLAFELYASGQYNDREVAAELNRRGYLTANKTGRRPFSKDTVCAMLKNRFFLADFPRLYHSADDEQKKRLFQSMIERAYVRDGQIVALQPTAPFYPLLIASCGLDGHSVSITLKAIPRPLSVAILSQPLAV